MKAVLNIANTKHKITAIAGIMVAVVLLIQQPIQFYLNGDKIADTPSGYVQTDEASQDEKNEQSSSSFVVKAYDVVIPVLQINLDQTYFLLEDLLEIDSFFPSIEENILLKNDYYFTVLFRQIISPNAP